MPTEAKTYWLRTSREQFTGIDASRYEIST